MLEKNKNTKEELEIQNFSICCESETIPPDWEMAEEMGSMWRAYACNICKKCGKVCEVVNGVKNK